jgi:hypothetical protein
LSEIEPCLVHHVVRAACRDFLNASDHIGEVLTSQVHGRGVLGVASGA